MLPRQGPESSIARGNQDGASSPPKRAFRPEVEGLRFLAVFLVVIYHVWLGRVSGGVDIFLLISAFLMTGQFVRRIERDEPIRLGKHWLHLLKRLLPVAVLVIAVTVLLSWWLLPGNRWPSIISDAWASLFYFENWAAAFNSVDYYAAHNVASPFQHFWSLSMQAQVFLLWPIIFAALALLRRKLGWNLKTMMWIVFGGIFVASLAFSIIFTQSNQSFAYFDLRTRLWEFALGSLLALALPHLKMSRAVRVLIGWLGLLLIISCGLVLQVDQQFPGYLALWPTLAAAMVIAAGSSASKFGADRILSAPFMRFMGGNSYALYLWHWPILVIFLSWQNRDSVDWLTGAAIILLAALLAILSTKFVERPVRRFVWVEAAWHRPILLVSACVFLAIVPLLGWQGAMKAQVIEASKNSSADNPGAAALVPGFEPGGNPEAPTQPAASKISEQFAVLDSSCAGKWLSEVKEINAVCRSHSVTDSPAKSIVVIGDSHSEQWMPALQYAADQNNWQMISIIKAACPYSTSQPTASDDCNAFNAEATDYLLQRSPDAVLMVGTAAKPSSPEEVLQPGFTEATTELIANGISVVAMRDNPRFAFNMAECVISKGSQADDCNPQRGDLLAELSPFESLEAKPPGLITLDMSDYICAQNSCPGVIGNIFVYIDDNHLTKDYSASMGPVFAQRLLKASGWASS
ncbi:acyltransferase [Psychromicrobium lacuslunae]|uniref:Acyltransferase n=2 Tax=Psychromicrobium lacuslunae TaxID=1618207 RepID=A0A0D4BZ96_9MICC|nr:acyltransferase [Psychromicrobium lacuslunae]